MAHTIRRLTSSSLLGEVLCNYIESHNNRYLPVLVLLLCALLLTTRANAAEVDNVPDDLTGLSLESLMNIQVTSVSKRAENLSDAAAAVYVLSGDDIRRSGARNLPEALRLVPGLTVARIDANNWAVTARGFNNANADKLEVLMDGRTLYTPLISGVFWDVQDTFLDDIDRIEVIRGPGATLWGANAVNGVINIVTKSAGDTQGTVFEAGGGGEFQGFGGARHGGALGETGHYRVYAKTSHYDAFTQADGTSANDEWDLSQAGFRTDWSRGELDRYTIQGDIYDGTLGNVMRDETVSGHNLIMRWTRILSESSDMSLQFFYDHVERDAPFFSDKRDAYDLDFQHRFRWRPAHEIVWGLGYRRNSDRMTLAPSPPFGFAPESRSTESFSLFVQDQIDVTDKLKITLGSKFEDNDYTGFEVQPTARFAYLLDDKRTLWGAVSRAVRIPNRVDHDILAPPFVVGDRNFDSETVIAYELGYRTQLRDNLSLDTALYYNDYDKLRGVNNSTAPPTISNEGEAKGYGLETSVQWIVRPDWRLYAGYNYQHLDHQAKSGSTDTSIATSNRNDPHHQFFLRSAWNLRDNWMLDGALRHVSGLPDQNVDAYTELDLRLARKLGPNAEFALSGRNLLHSSHVEFGAVNPIEIERGIYGTFTWHFE